MVSGRAGSVALPFNQYAIGKAADSTNCSRLELGCIATVDSCGRTIWIADAQRGDGKRFVVHADEELTAFMELNRQFTRGIACDADSSKKRATITTLRCGESFERTATPRSLNVK
jgi:hypothetical protein